VPDRFCVAFMVATISYFISGVSDAILQCVGVQIGQVTTPYEREGVRAVFNSSVLLESK
jgi:hypothetical protein